MTPLTIIYLALIPAGFGLVFAVGMGFWLRHQKYRQHHSHDLSD